jgi:hypothetical protein
MVAWFFIKFKASFLLTDRVMSPFGIWYHVVSLQVAYCVFDLYISTCCYPYFALVQFHILNMVFRFCLIFRKPPDVTNRDFGFSVAEIARFIEAGSSSVSRMLDSAPGPELSLAWSLNNRWRATGGIFAGSFVGWCAGLSLNMQYFPFNQTYQPSAGIGLQVSRISTLVHFDQSANVEIPSAFGAGLVLLLCPARFRVNDSEVSLCNLQIGTDLGMPGRALLIGVEVLAVSFTIRKMGNP